jgi:hypothetical protein
MHFKSLTTLKITKMKWLFFLSLVLLSVLPLHAQSDKKSAGGAAILWERSNFDLGDIIQGERVEQSYHFTNSGNEPLIITNVEVTCGCTTPKGWPRDPIAPGGKGELVVAFSSAGKYGRQHKVITIVSNAVNQESSQITFTANVLEKRSPK